MAGRRPQSPTMPSATRRAPGSIPAIWRRPWNTSSSPPVPSAQDALEVGRPRPRLHPDRLHPAGHPDPLARHDRGDRRGGPGPLGQRLVGRQHRRRGAAAVAPARAVHAVPPARCRSARTRRRPCRPSGAPAAPIGRTSAPARRSGRRRRRGRWWRSRGAPGPARRRSGRPCGRAAGAARPAAKPRRGSSTVHSVSPSSVASAASSSAARAEPPVRALDDVERQARQPEPAPLLLELAGGLGVDVEVHGPQVVGRQRPRVLQGPRRGHVQAVDEDHDDVAAQHRRLATPRPRPPRAARPRARTGGAGGCSPKYAERARRRRSPRRPR